jgi:hypothetical protein
MTGPINELRNALSQCFSNDGVLVFSLLYLGVDMQHEWEGFSKCQRPIHKWLMITYGLIVMHRISCVVGGRYISEGSDDFLLSVRHKSIVPRFLMSVAWLVLPCFTVWTLMGSLWTWEINKLTPHCLPVNMQMWFIITWQIVSYVWILVHICLGIVAWVNERRLHSVETDLRAVTDEQTTTRWGQVSSSDGFVSLAHAHEGLRPAEISMLPTRTAKAGGSEECSICLHTIQAGEPIRQLDSCKHAFHRECIDLWLLRRADCPLCKCCVSCGPAIVEHV